MEECLQAKNVFRKLSLSFLHLVIDGVNLYIQIIPGFFQFFNVTVRLGQTIKEPLVLANELNFFTYILYGNLHFL